MQHTPGTVGAAGDPFVNIPTQTVAQALADARANGRVFTLPPASPRFHIDKAIANRARSTALAMARGKAS